MFWEKKKNREKVRLSEGIIELTTSTCWSGQGEIGHYGVFIHSKIFNNIFCQLMHFKIEFLYPKLYFCFPSPPASQLQENKDFWPGWLAFLFAGDLQNSVGCLKDWCLKPKPACCSDSHQGILACYFKLVHCWINFIWELV